MMTRMIKRGGNTVPGDMIIEKVGRIVQTVHGSILAAVRDGVMSSSLSQGCAICFYSVIMIPICF